MGLLKDTVRSLKFRYDILSREGIKLGEVECLRGEVSMKSLARIKGLGRFSIRENEARDIDFLNDLIAPVVIISDGENEEQFELGQYIMSSPARVLNKNQVTRQIEAYDLCQILAEDKLTERLYIPMGANYVESIVRVIHGAQIMRVHIDPSPAKTRREKEFEVGMDKLSVVNQLLNEINYTSLFAEQNGRLRAKPYILPAMRTVEVLYQEDEYDLTTKDQITDELDLFSVPNYWIVAVSNPDLRAMVSHLENRNPTSPTSTISRRRRIVDYRQIDDISDQETLDAYTRRIASNTGVYQKIEFATALNPKHWFGTAIHLANEALGVSGKYIEQEWTMPLVAGASMKHLARRSLHEF